MTSTKRFYQRVKTVAPNRYVSKHDSVGVTFKDNKVSSIHRWYPYIEGFSGSFVREALKELKTPNGPVLDPFGGCGTTSLECCLNGIDSYSVDVSPFMVFVSTVKTTLKLNLSILLRERDSIITLMRGNQNGIKPDKIISPLFAEMSYFSPKIFYKIACLKSFIRNVSDYKVRNLFLLALSSILVSVSNLKRAPDLKFRDKPLLNENVDELFFAKVDQFYHDLKVIQRKPKGQTHVIHNSAKNITALGKSFNGSFSCIITSPPYLNGTNYCRNTKLEMWILDYIRTDKDLKSFRHASISASINTTFLTQIEPTVNVHVRKLVEELKKDAYDNRIPVMANNYFADMKSTLFEMYRLLAKKGSVAIVIGDSMFGGVHVPTDILLREIAEEIGFNCFDFRIVRERKSRSGCRLQETIIYLKK